MAIDALPGGSVVARDFWKGSVLARNADVFLRRAGDKRLVEEKNTAGPERPFAAGRVGCLFNPTRDRVSRAFDDFCLDGAVP
jgi:hypothetical protein